MSRFYVGFGALASGIALSAMVGPAGAALRAVDLADAFSGAVAPELAQIYSYRGVNYCWYDHGWKGPGWYVCGHPDDQGYDWGGPMGRNEPVRGGHPKPHRPRPGPWPAGGGAQAARGTTSSQARVHAESQGQGPHADSRQQSAPGGGQSWVPGGSGGGGMSSSHH